MFNSKVTTIWSDKWQSVLLIVNVLLIFDNLHNKSYTLKSQNQYMYVKCRHTHIPHYIRLLSVLSDRFLYISISICTSYMKKHKLTSNSIPFKLLIKCDYPTICLYDWPRIAVNESFSFNVSLQQYADIILCVVYRIEKGRKKEK